jgi:FeS assembly SUF system protein
MENNNIKNKSEDISESTTKNIDSNSELEKKAWNALSEIFDPEIPVNIVDLGLIYEIKINESKEIEVLMTLTAPNCPEAELLPVQVEERLKAIHDVKDAKVVITFDPPWDRSMLSEEAQLMLGLY